MCLKIILAVAMAVYGVNSFGYYDHDYERTALGDAIDKTSIKFLYEAYKNAEEKNVVSSPLGIMTLLSLYSAGAGVKSKKQINQFLGGGDPKKVSDSFSSLSKILAAYNASSLTIADKIYVAKKYAINANFGNIARSYGSEVEPLDFLNRKAAANEINHWADLKTEGNIKDPVSPDDLDPDTAAALFNIIFFKGHWHVPFEKSETEEKDFHINQNTTVKKPTMHLQQSLFYAENPELGYKLVELPYKEAGCRMVVVLPDKIDGLPEVLSKINERGLLTDVFNLAPAGREINLELPKFEVKSKLDLNELLPKVGVTDIFHEGAPEIVKDATVVVSKAFQEAFVKVDEEGATAGAFTGVVIEKYSLDSDPAEIMNFKANHPFLFLILYEDKVIFIGTYTN